MSNAKPKIFWAVFVRGKYFIGNYERKADAVYAALWHFEEDELKDKKVTFEKVAVLPLKTFNEIVMKRENDRNSTDPSSHAGA